jgi:heme A synthase
MSLVLVHDRLANTAALFIAILGVWALVLRVRNRPLDSAWFGAAVIGEVLIIVQGLLGGWLYLQGLGAALPRPFMHILYGVVAVLTIPAAYGYFGGLEDENVKSLAMAFVCLFLWGIIMRATSVAAYPAPL